MVVLLSFSVRGAHYFLCLTLSNEIKIMIAARTSILDYSAAYDLSLHPLVQPYIHNNPGSNDTSQRAAYPQAASF
jgi:hypothetical protein